MRAMVPPTTRPLRVDERDAAVETLAASFDDDPLFCWMLPEAHTRRAWIAWFHRVSVEASLATRTAWTLTEGPGLGAITVVPPGAKPPGLDVWIKALRAPPRRAPTWRLASVGLRVQARIDAAHPREPVVYVHVLGVHPAQKGRGLGGALLGEALALGSSLGVPVYLETSNPVNLGFYGRYGLRVRREIRVGDAPPLWTLQTDGAPPAR
jgi:GNAT superfamily N-acetyltransferase